MTINTLALDELRGLVAELDRSLFNHEEWMDGLIGTLICGLQPDERDLYVDAHRKCRLGQWYFSDNPIVKALAKRPGFVELGVEHERMHTHAASMLRSRVAGEEVSLREYQRFISAVKNVRMEIATLKEDIEKTLHAIDPLTNVPGRLGMLTKLRELQALVERRIQSCCLVMMDMDKFKAINDRFGHASGDYVLVSFTRFLTRGLRPYDIVFRYGGEEFVIVLPGTTCDEGLGIIERLREGMASLPLDMGADGLIYTTASFGLVSLEPDVSVEQSIERADKALYAAKTAGRNCSVVWDPSMNAHPTASQNTSV